MEIRGLDAFDGVVQSALIGGLTAGVLEGAGQVAGKALGALAETSIGKTVTSAVSRARGELMDKIAESPAAKKAVALLKKSGCGCFTENTQVITANGLKDIENIREGDSVWAYNEQNGQKELKRVTHAFSLSREGNYTLYLGDNAIEVTSDHPFYVNKQWIKAAQLQPGDKIQLFSNENRSIDSIHYTAGYTTVYNFEVEQNHNYYVGLNGVLVHNGTCFGRPPSYESDFYKPENIIGYTGDLNNDPTVYFKEGDRFGHITQNHKYSSNIGRNKVREFTDYTIRNQNVKGEIKAQEFYDGKVKHTSRKPFTEVTDDNRGQLATAIKSFRYAKSKVNK